MGRCVEVQLLSRKKEMFLKISKHRILAADAGPGGRGKPRTQRYISLRVSVGSSWL